MAVEPLEHTADAGIAVRAGTLGELFAEAAYGLCAAITDPSAVACRQRDAVTVAAPDLEQLMVDWLGELLYRFETARTLPARAEVAVEGDAAAGWRLTGRVEGEVFDPERHPLRVAVKAITYHGLSVEPTGDGWRATVIFDI